MTGRLPTPVAGDRFRRELRARLIAEATARASHRPWWHRSSVSSGWLRPALTLAVIALVVALGAGTTAAGSLPGDAVYGLKLAAGEVRLAFTFDETARVTVLADQAEARSAELTVVIATRPDVLAKASTEAAAAAGRLAAAVGRLSPRTDHPDETEKRDDALDAAEHARDHATDVLRKVQERAPAEAQPGILNAIDQLQKIKPEARPIRTPKVNSSPPPEKR